MSQLISAADHSRWPWWVLRTRSRQEKILARDLRRRGIKSFLPLLTCTMEYGGREATVERPVFPGYLFLRADGKQACEAGLMHRVVQIIPVADQDARDHELRNIYLALCGRATLAPAPYQRDGLRAKVRDGPFRGLQGVIQPAGQRDRLILQVEILGRAVSIEIDGSLLEIMETERDAFAIVTCKADGS